MINFILSFIPRALPTNRAQLDRLISSVLALAPYASESHAQRAVQFAVASLMFRLEGKKNGWPKIYVSDRYFVAWLHRQTANEVAHGFMEELKAAQKQEDADREATAQAEKTMQENKPQLSVVPNDKN